MSIKTNTAIPLIKYRISVHLGFTDTYTVVYLYNKDILSLAEKLNEFYFWCTIQKCYIVKGNELIELRFLRNLNLHEKDLDIRLIRRIKADNLQYLRERLRDGYNSKLLNKIF